MNSSTTADQAMHARLKKKAEEAKNILEQQQGMNSAGPVSDAKNKPDLQIAKK